MHRDARAMAGIAQVDGMRMPHDSRQPDVSVVMPCRDAERWLDQAIASVRAQQYEDWELWIVDDASRDRSTEIAISHAREDSRIGMVHLQESVGGALARNHAIRRARGRYIAFLDADDWWRPDKLAVQLADMRAKAAAFGYTAYEKCDERSHRCGRFFHPPCTVDYATLLRTCVIGCSTVMLDTHCLGKRYMPPLAMAHDYALWLEILREGHIAHGCPSPLTIYRERRGSLSANKVSKSLMVWRIYRHREALDTSRCMALMSSYAWNGLYKRFI